MFSPFEHPDVQKILGFLIDSLFDESGRGALLIATSHVDDHLTQLLEAAMPSDLSKNHKDKIFKYPGPLSSFASKIELAYVFRLINKNLYDSLNALRRIRNDAAHSPSKFELHELNERLKLVFDLGPGVPNFIKEVSTEAMVDYKMRMIRSRFDESNLDEERRREILNNLINDKERMANLERQVPFWELVYGLSLLCGLLIYERDQVNKLTNDMKLWTDLAKTRSENQDNGD